jgi:peptidoglycan-associated lipoprotein
VGPQKATDTPQQSANSGVVQISDEIRAACGIDRGDAYFPFDSYSLQTKDVPVLNKVAGCFTNGALKGRGLRLVGHADPRGPSDYNLVLGQNRADSVAGYLRRQGVSQSQAEATSRGAMDATGTNEATWAQDRRVDVMIRP